MVDWFGKAIALPKEFITSTKGSKGGGVIQGSASECVLVNMLAARNQAIQELKKNNPDMEDSAFLPKIVAYCSKESHSCVEKAALILLVKLRVLDPDENCCLRGEILKKAMEEDEAQGLIPFFVSTTLGSTACCAFDKLEEIGPICKERNVWLHVDGAYAGNAFICPELQPLMKGIEYADSFNTNPNKWLLVNFDCSVMWVKDRMKLTSALVVEPLYLQHANSDETIDYRHWGIPLSRRFRSLKLWFVMRKYGIKGLQKYIRNHIKLAKHFESLVKKDSRFEVVNDVRLGLVCFRLQRPDNYNQLLLATINASGKLHMIPSMVKGKYIIRFCVVAENSTQEDVEHAWNVIEEQATELLQSLEKRPVKIESFVKPLRPQLTRQKSRRYSFTRSVSKELYSRSMSKSNLYDGATPILVPDEEEAEAENHTNEDILDQLTSTPSVEDNDVFSKEFEKFRIEDIPQKECSRVT